MNKPLVLATALATLLVTKPVLRADLFWDGTGTSWNNPLNWATALGDGTPDPIAVPGATDLAIFSARDLTTAQPITLDGDQTALGLVTNSGNKHVITLRGGGTNRILSLGTQGIDHRAGGLDIGSNTDGQQVSISLLGSQTWNSSSSGTTQARAIFVFNGVSLGVAGSHTLTLTGTTTGGTFSGAISDGSGTLSLTKEGGTGRWTMTGANTYTGATTIRAGILAVSTIANGGDASSIGASSNAASNLVFDGGTLVYSGGSASTDRGFTISNGKTAVFDISTASSTLTIGGPSVATTGALTKQGAGGLDLSSAHTFTGGTNVSLGRLTLSGAGALGSSTITLGQANNTTPLNTIAGTAILTVTGAGGSVTRAANLTVVGGVLSDTTGVRTLLVQGAAAADSHDSFGALTINNGSFWAHIVPDAARNARVTFDSLQRAEGTQLHFGNGSTQIGTTSIASATAGTANVDFVTAPTLTGGALGTSSAGILPYATVNGIIATYDPANGLRPLDTATEMRELASATAGENAKLTNAGTTTLTANTTVNSLWGNQGTIALGTQALSVTSGAIAASGNLTIGATPNDGTLDLGAAQGNVMVGDGAVLTINSVIAGSAGLNVGLTSSTSNTATLVLGGANTFTGATILTGNSSALKVTLANPLALQNSIVQFVNNGAGLRFGGNDPGSGGVVDLTSATIGGLRGPQGISLANSGPAGGGVALTVGTALSSEDTTYTGVISGPGSLIKDGPMTLTLQGGSSNTYTGGTTIKQGILAVGKAAGTTKFNAIPGDLIIDGGKLRFLDDNQIADTANVVMNGADSTFNGTATNAAVRGLLETIGSLTVNGGSVNTGAHGTGITVTGAATFIGGAGNTTFLGNSGSRFTVGSLSLKGMTETAGGTVATPNSFSVYGNATTRSRLTVGAGGLTLDGSVLNMRQGGTGSSALGSHLVINGDVTTTGTSPSRIWRDANGGTAGEISIDLSSSAENVNRTFNIGGGGADFSSDIPIVNGSATGGAITKTGPGTMTLFAASTYTGGTTINEGTLLANNTSGSATGPGPVSVNAMGTLGGTGTVTGAVSIASGGTLMAGTGQAAFETLTLAGNLSLADDSEIKLTLGPSGTHSTLLRQSGDWTFASEQAFTFIDLSDLGGLAGFYDNIIVNLAGAPAGIGQWTVTNSGLEGTFTFDGSNVDLNLTVVPEPTSAVFLLASATLLGGFRRLRRRAA